MKALKVLSVLFLATALSWGIVSCGDDPEKDSGKGLLDGTWLVTADDWKGIVAFDKETYRIEEYHDDYGYGFYVYKGNFYGTVKYWSNDIALFSSETDGWLKDGYISHIIGIELNKPSLVTDEMVLKEKDGKEYRFKRSTGAISQRSDIYGVWQKSSLSGNVYTYVNGEKGKLLEDVSQGSLSEFPEEIGISQSTLKNTEGGNAYLISNKGTRYEKTYFANMSLQGQRIQASGSGYDWLDERFTWHVISVNTEELRVSIEGPDSPRMTNCDYLELEVVYRRIRTL